MATAAHVNQLCNRLLALLEDGPREDSRRGMEASTLLEELTAVISIPREEKAPFDEQVEAFAETAMDGFERWFGPQPLDAEPHDQYRAAPEVEKEIREAISSLQDLARQRPAKERPG